MKQFLQKALQSIIDFIDDVTSFEEIKTIEKQKEKALHDAGLDIPGII